MSKKCFKKKSLSKFFKCMVKTVCIFWISIFYSLWFYNLKSKFKKEGDKIKVFAGVSGGVDSGVAASILKKEGYEVVGVFIKVYQPEVETFCWRNEMLDAKKVCTDLDIPFVFLNLEKEYKRDIFDYMIESYKKGKTPNPDVFCNKFIKFGAFLDLAISAGADFVATGHYARKRELSNGQFELLKAFDESKDQAYFLSAISQAQLSKIIFPLGEIYKSEVRKIAAKSNIFNFSKKDSQGLCFVGKVNMKDFLQNFLPKRAGDVLSVDGEVIGGHDGVEFYTIGSRHGFEIFPEKKTPNMPRLFVLEKDFENNTLTVGAKDENLDKLDFDSVVIEDLTWIGEPAKENVAYEAQVRYHSKYVGAKINYLDNGFARVRFNEPQRAVAAGQVLVLYNGHVLLGGGVIV